MGSTSICREFIKKKITESGCNDCNCNDCNCNITCSICTAHLMNECDTVLVVNTTKSALQSLQCVHCYAKTAGIGNAHLPSQQISNSTSNPATPSAPRARNISDVNEFGCAADAATAVASASFASFMTQQEPPILATYAPTLQASPAMLTCDGMYHSNLTHS